MSSDLQGGDLTKLAKQAMLLIVRGRLEGELDARRGLYCPAVIARIERAVTTLALLCEEEEMKRHV